MTRIGAAATHFGISFLVGISLLAMCWFVWYPAPMLVSIGGQQIFFLIVGIDVAIGPLLTLVVFQKGKKSLKFDLAVIALLQIAAMCYGTSTLLEARPAYVAALGDRFQVIQATEVTDANIEKAQVTLPWWGPKWVGTKAPVGRADIDAVDMLKAVGAGRGHLPQLHVPYGDMKSEILQKALGIDVLKKNNASDVAEIDKWLSRRGYSESNTKFQPIRIVAYEYVVMVDANTAEVIGIAPFKP